MEKYARSAFAGLHPLLSWKRVCCVLLVITISQFIWLQNTTRDVTTSIRSIRQTQKSASWSHPSTQTAFSADEEIADNLSTAECNEYFPDLYAEVDRSVAYWKRRKHTITKNDTDISWRETSGGGAMRLLVHNNELRIIESQQTMNHMGYRGRALGLLNLFQRAVDSATAGGEKLPSVEFAVIVQDNPGPPTNDGTHSFMTWDRWVGEKNYDRLWMVPSFDFWFASPMGSFTEAKRRAKERDAPFQDKIQKAVWRGSSETSPLRQQLVNITKQKDWADVHAMDSKDYEGFGQHRGKGMMVEDFCKYGMTIHTEGISYSGRLKYLLNCNSLLIAHEMIWTTSWYHLLQKDGPNQNFVQVKRDWSDLEEKVKYYFNHPAEAEKIIANAVATFREKALTRAAVSCYSRRLIQGYASVAYEPVIYKSAKFEGQAKQVRGVGFEQFMDNPNDMMSLLAE